MTNLSRLEVRAVRCPECGARSGQRCVGVRGKAREANHRSRIVEAEWLAQRAGTAVATWPHQAGRAR